MNRAIHEGKITVRLSDDAKNATVELPTEDLLNLVYGSANHLGTYADQLRRNPRPGEEERSKAVADRFSQQATGLHKLWLRVHRRLYPGVKGYGRR